MIRYNLRNTNRTGSKHWYSVVNQTTERTKSDSAILDFTPDDVNENFANICHTDNYLEPENKEIHNGAYPGLTLHESYHILRKLKKTVMGLDDIRA